MRPEIRHVLVVTRAIAPLHGVGGLERHGYDLVTHLLDRGLRVTLITQPPASPGAGAALTHERLALHVVPYRTFPLAGAPGIVAVDRSTSYLWFGRRAGQLAARLVRGGGIQLVHGMGASVLGYAAAREADALETVPLLLNPHGMEEFGSTGPGLGLAKRIAYAPLRRAVRRCARAADRVVATDRVLVPIVTAHLRVSASRVAVVPNAVDTDAIGRLTATSDVRAMRARHGIAAGDVIVVGVGRLEENKGFHLLVQALARLRASKRSPAVRSWRLVLLGEGSQRSRLEREIARAGLQPSVLLAGRVSDAELHAWYAAANLFVHPSLYEGSSIVTLEAMAHRLPVVATTAGGLPDKVRPGTNGWLVPPGDVEALTSALASALSNDAPLAAMGDASRAIVDREFAWPAVMDRLLGVYEEMLSRSSR